MKKAILAIAVLSTLGFSTISQAAPSLGPTGVINFIGTLNAETCSVSDAGASSTGGNLSYDMGAVAVKTLGTEADPAHSITAGNVTTPISMNLRLECAGSVSVELKLTPTARVNQGIRVSGGATNVQIMLMQGTSPLNFGSGSVTLPAPLSSGVANIALSAYYTLQNGKAISDVQSGPANGSAAYVLSYN